ncbi:MAG: DMT family transporter [Chloroflexota bacterium]|nr:DMT family transporter [Chloroflexota bacterium]
MNTAAVLAILIALATGAIIGLQGPLNSQLTRTIGLMESTFLVHLTGALVLGLALSLGLGNGNLSAVGQAPPFSLSGGVLGVLIVAGVVVSISRLGVVAGIAVALIGQLAVAAVIDHFGLFGSDPRPVGVWTLLGIALLITGAVAVRR